MAGVGPADIDVVEMYDMFSPVVLWGLGAYRFCEWGSAGDFVCDGNLDGGPQAVLALMLQSNTERLLGIELDESTLPESVYYTA
jgi:hypothetical protein